MMRTCVICLMIRVQTRKIVKNTADVLSLVSSFLVSWWWQKDGQDGISRVKSLYARDYSFNVCPGQKHCHIWAWHASHIYIYGWVHAWNSQYSLECTNKSILACQMSTHLVVTASVTLTNIISISSVLSLIWPHASAQRSNIKRRGGVTIELSRFWTTIERRKR